MIGQHKSIEVVNMHWFCNSSLLLEKKLDIKDFEGKFNDIINLVNNNAPIKIIYKNNTIKAAKFAKNFDI